MGMDATFLLCIVAVD